MSYPARFQHLHAPDGGCLSFYGWLPEAPHAVVQIAHGMGEHAARYGRVARALAAQGYAVYANNHRGHGAAALSPHTRGEFGEAGFEAVVGDMAVLTAHARQAHPGLPLVLLGHSMGALASQLYVLDHSAGIDGLALSGTTALDLMLEARGVLRRLEDANTGIERPRTDFDWLSRDADEVDAYVADPLCGFSLSRASMQSMAGAGLRTCEAGAFKAVRSGLPIYLFTGDQDPVNGHLQWFHPLVRRLQGAGLADVTTRIYPGARHEVLNETNREEVLADLLAWLARVTRS